MTWPGSSADGGTEQALPHSVEHLTDLVGRVPLNKWIDLEKGKAYDVETIYPSGKVL